MTIPHGKGQRLATYGSVAHYRKLTDYLRECALGEALFGEVQECEIVDPELSCCQEANSYFFARSSKNQFSR
jgi:hypothetical protein